MDQPSGASLLRTLAFYLPQYHPVAENDKWWGAGFTEWRNVVRAKPLFKGHYQPHLPADLGFYYLRVPETREAQADLADAYGITGFCYYHYWFNGRRLLSRPFDEVFRSGRPRFPFCLCWANENWTRRWDGHEHEVLLAQQYSPEDDRHHMEHLLPALADERYVRIHGRPFFLVYRTGNLPDPARTADVWREVCVKAGLPNPYLAGVESLGHEVDPRDIGFDAAVEFAPHWKMLPAPHRCGYAHSPTYKAGVAGSNPAPPPLSFATLRSATPFAAALSVLLLCRCSEKHPQQPLTGLSSNAVTRMSQAIRSRHRREDSPSGTTPSCWAMTRDSRRSSLAR